MAKEYDMDVEKVKEYLPLEDLQQGRSSSRRLWT